MKKNKKLLITTKKISIQADVISFQKKIKMLKYFIKIKILKKG